ncbi:MAG: helix-turn-helix domain-containing protein [Bryobacteraceae bacterium]
MSAGIDLAAKLMVVYHRRAGGQSQHSTHLDLDAVSDRVQSAITYAEENLGKPLSMEDLAGAVFLSPRQFSRLCRNETGQTPARAIERLRVESARLMMETGRFPANEIALRNRFGNRDRMRRSFIRVFGKSSQTIQRDFGAASL